MLDKEQIEAIEQFEAEQKVLKRKSYKLVL